MPVNSFGDDDTTMFHVAVIVSDRPLAIMARFADTANSVEWNVSNASAPIRLIMPPMMVGLMLPILFMINGVILANIMNIVIPVAISKMYDVRRILCLSNLKSRNGGTILLSRRTKTNNEIADAMNVATICGRFSELTPICISVSAKRNEVIVAESARTPLMSIENDKRFLFEVISGALAVID